ncbi:hypothetical protein GCM10010388_66440 [Streptomyces mauvecolor]
MGEARGIRTRVARRSDPSVTRSRLAAFTRVAAWHRAPRRTGGRLRPLRRRRPEC